MKTNIFKVGDVVVCIYDTTIRGIVSKENFVPAQPEIFAEECQFLYLNGNSIPTDYTSEAFVIDKSAEHEKRK